jgi:hypothetical protein
MSADNLIGLAGNLIGLTCICLPIIGLLMILLFILPSTRGYIFAFIFHLIIKFNSEQATAVVKQVDNVGDGWYVKHSDFELGHMVAQLVKVTLEVHPQNGASYIAQDRFSANADVYDKLSPGTEMQVAISRFNPAWVAAYPKTIAPNPRNNMMPGSISRPGTVKPKFAPPPPMQQGAPAMTTADGQPLNPHLQAAMVTQDQYYFQLQQTGIEAKAVVLTSTNMNIRASNIAWVYDITLDVTSPTGEHFQSKTQATIVDKTAHKYAVGKMAIVRFDPNNRAQCTLVHAVES